MPGRAFSTHAADPSVIDALHDGVPEWMRSSLDGWLRGQLKDSSYTSYADAALVQRIERLLRISLGGGRHISEVMGAVFSIMNSDENVKLDVVDALLQLEGTPYSGTDALETILSQSGSKWMVGRDQTTNIYSLQQRVDGTVSQAVDELTDQGGDVATYLSMAWNDAFGRSPNHSAAYSNIIKAVEAACWQIVTPSDNRSTLGTIIRELRDHPERFRVSIDEQNAGSGIESIRKQMSFIWEGQTDRHGTANPTAPTREAAEQAIFIGLSLCQQFTRGLIARA